LTYLDYGASEQRGADTQTRLEIMELENWTLKQRDSLNADAIANLSDKLQELMARIRSKLFYSD
jgi:uncharacterized FlaG/YvyC family protein